MSVGAIQQRSGADYTGTGTKQTQTGASSDGFASILEQACGQDTEQTDALELLRQRKEEILDKLQNGNTQESYQIGGQSYTQKEWDHFLAKFDAAEDQIKEEVEEEQEKKQEDALEEKETRHETEPSNS